MSRETDISPWTLPPRTLPPPLYVCVCVWMFYFVAKLLIWGTCVVTRLSVLKTLSSIRLSKLSASQSCWSWELRMQMSTSFFTELVVTMWLGLRRNGFVKPLERILVYILRFFSLIKIFRSTSKSRPNNIGGKMSVRPYVRRSTKSFFDLNEIWYIGILECLLMHSCVHFHCCLGISDSMVRTISKRANRQECVSHVWPMHRLLLTTTVAGEVPHKTYLRHYHQDTTRLQSHNWSTQDSC